MNKSYKLAKNILFIFTILLILLWTIFPIYITFITSLKNKDIAFSIPPIWKFTPTLQNYKNVFIYTDFKKYFLNSIIVASTSTAISIAVGCIASYSFARFAFFGKNALLLFFLIVRMFPPIALAIPMFLVGSFLGLIDTKTILILTHVALNLPFVIWMMYDFFRLIPKELDEAAMVDGCRRIGAFFRVVLPLTSPGLVATSIFCVLLSWNDFLFALMLTGRNAKTVAVAITMFTTAEGIEWGNISAAAFTIILPVLCFAIAIRNYMVRGLTMGTLKE